MIDTLRNLLDKFLGKTNTTSPFSFVTLWKLFVVHRLFLMKSFPETDGDEQGATSAHRTVLGVQNQ